MAKKILSILAIVCLSIIIAPSVFAAATDCGPITGVAGSEVCKAGTGADCISPKVCTMNAGKTACSCVAPPASAVGNVFGPSNCVKIRSTFTMNLTGASGDVETTLSTGAIVAPKILVSTECTYGAVSSPCNNSITGACVLYKPSEIGIVATLNTIYTVTNWVFFLLTILAVLMIIYGGFIYITAAGDPAKATKGKSVLTFAVIGLAIALLAKFVPSLVRFILGV